MGINGLLQKLSFATTKSNVSDFEGKSFAVDFSCWLHCAARIKPERYVESLEKGRVDSQCVQKATNYIVKRCDQLLKAGASHLHLVLDGHEFPLKAQTNDDRQSKRRENLATARTFKIEGNDNKARSKYSQSVTIVPDFSQRVVEGVKNHFAQKNVANVCFVQSPCESDPQLVKLCLQGIANVVVTEDSDVLVYSASCNFSFPILYKLKRDTGACDVITMDWLLNPNAQPNWTQPNEKKQKGGGSFESILKSLVSSQSQCPGVGARLFVQACVLAGCDYCPSQLNGVGLVTAFKLVRDNAHHQPADRFRKALESLSQKACSTINVTEYEELLSKSEAVFYHHPILDMDSKRIIPLIVPRTTEEPKSAESQMVSDSHPSLHRFQGDWSFLGMFTTAGGLKQDDDDDGAIPISEIVIQHGESKVAPAVYNGGDAVVSAITRKVAVVNPYAKTKKRKRTDDGTVRAPLTMIERLGHESSTRVVSPERNDPDVKRVSFTPEDDETLRQLVKTHGRKFGAIGEIMRRTPSQCRSRWDNHLDPDVDHLDPDVSFTPEDDETLRQLVETHGRKFSAIGKIMRRTPSQCRNRWDNHLDPDVKRVSFTPEDDETLRQLVKTHGRKFSAIGKIMRRTHHQCRDRWDNHLEKRVVSAVAATPPGAFPLVEPDVNAGTPVGAHAKLPIRMTMRNPSRKRKAESMRPMMEPHLSPPEDFSHHPGLLLTPIKRVGPSPGHFRLELGDGKTQKGFEDINSLLCGANGPPSPLQRSSAPSPPRQPSYDSSGQPRSETSLPGSSGRSSSYHGSARKTPFGTAAATPRYTPMSQDQGASSTPGSKTQTDSTPVTNNRSEYGMLLPNAAYEVDFEVTNPPKEPVMPPSFYPVCIHTSEINEDDVLCGRGGGTNSQVGNRRFRKLVQDFQPTYLLARRKEKPLLARTIVLIIRMRGGRFLKKNDDTGELFEVGDAKAEAKTSQALREDLDVRATKSAANSLMDKKKKKKKGKGKNVEEEQEEQQEKEQEPEKAPEVKSDPVVEESSPSKSEADKRDKTPPPNLPALKGGEGMSGLVHPHSPEALQFRKRRRMRSGESVPAQDKFFPDFCPPRADLCRTSSPDLEDPTAMNLASTPPARNSTVDDEEDAQPGCANIAMDIVL